MRRRHEALRRVFGTMVEDVLAVAFHRLDAAQPADADAVRHLGVTIIRFSDRLFRELKVIRRFLFERMYRAPKVVAMRAEVTEVVRDLFALYLGDPGLLPGEWRPMSRSAGRGGAGAGGGRLRRRHDRPLRAAGTCAAPGVGLGPLHALHRLGPGLIRRRCHQLARAAASPSLEAGAVGLRYPAERPILQARSFGGPAVGGCLRHGKRGLHEPRPYRFRAGPRAAGAGRGGAACRRQAVPGADRGPARRPGARPAGVCAGAGPDPAGTPRQLRRPRRGRQPGGGQHHHLDARGRAARARAARSCPRARPSRISSRSSSTATASASRARGRASRWARAS
jgi:hypothetical protein